MLYARLRTLLMVELAVLMPVMPALVGCSNGAGGNTNANQADNNTNANGIDTTGADAIIQINTDPDDPMIAQLTGVENNDTLVFFGQKDSNGLVSKVESMQYFEPGATEPYTFQFDDDTRPTFITGPNGEVATLTYEGDSVAVTFKDADGETFVESFNLGEGAESARARTQAALEGIQQTSARLASATATTVRTIRGKLTINVAAGSEPAGTVKDAKVSVVVTNGEGIIPVGFNSATNQYEFTVAHRVKDLQVLIDECESMTGGTATALGVTGLILAILAVACIGATGGFCAFILGPAGAITGVGIGGAGMVATGANYACDDLVYAAAVKGGQGQQTVSITATHPTLGFSEGTVVTYDLFDPADPINAAGEFSASITIQIQAAITNVTTSPAAPAEWQSYQVVFSFIPPSASISYTISGTDGYSFSETLTGDGSGTSLTGSSIPGGASGVTDTITASISVGGTQVGDASTISITFH